MTDPRHTSEYQRLRKAFLARHAPGSPCALCGRPVDTTLSGRASWGPTVEHTYPVRDHPHLALETALWKLAHARCQQQQGARATNAKRRGQGRGGPPMRRPEREW